MFHNKNWGLHRSNFYRVNARIAVCCAVMSGVMLAWSSCVKAEEYATVHIGETANATVHVDSQTLDVQNLDASAALEVSDNKSIPIVTEVTDPDLPGVAHLDISTEGQESQLALAGSQDMRPLDVVDTGSSVKFPNAVGELGGGIDDQKANVDSGDQPVTGSNDMIDQGDQLLVAGISAKSPVTNAADVHSQVGGDADSQLKDVSSDAASEESAGLPYAVVLALLALIGLVPVARRDDHHQV